MAFQCHQLPPRVMAVQRLGPWQSRCRFLPLCSVGTHWSSAKMLQHPASPNKNRWKVMLLMSLHSWHFPPQDMLVTCCISLTVRFEGIGHPTFRSLVPSPRLPPGIDTSMGPNLSTAAGPNCLTKTLTSSYHGTSFLEGEWSNEWLRRWMAMDGNGWLAVR